MTRFARALVTGGSRGLGAALVSQLLADGTQVVSIDREGGDAAEALTRISCDLSDQGALDQALPEILAAGPYDLVVFNAGISATGPFEAIPPEAHLKLLRVNTEAPMVMASALAGSGTMASGSVMSFVSSLSHFTGYPGAATYAASKDALAIYAKSIRKPFARRGIAVSTVFPGPLRTDHAERHAPSGADPEKRMTPDDAASEILAGIKAGKASIIPGGQNRFISVLGRVAPGLLTWQMRKLIFERLDKPVW